MPARQCSPLEAAVLCAARDHALDGAALDAHRYVSAAVGWLLHQGVLARRGGLVTFDDQAAPTSPAS